MVDRLLNATITAAHTGCRTMLNRAAIARTAVIGLGLLVGLCVTPVWSRISLLAASELSPPIIEEGPRYKVRNISLVGNAKLTAKQLTADLKLNGGGDFDEPKMNSDLKSIRDIYGSVGYIFADVQSEPCFLEESGQIDLTYKITEGKQYRIGRVDLLPEVDHPHARHQRVGGPFRGIRPGDIIDIRQVRAAERRLRASDLSGAKDADTKAFKYLYEVRENANGAAVVDVYVKDSALDKKIQASKTERAISAPSDIRTTK